MGSLSVSKTPSPSDSGALVPPGFVRFASDWRADGSGGRELYED